MMTKLLIKSFLLFFILFVSSSNVSLADVLNEIKVTGNDRISSETIIIFSDLKNGQEVTEDILNNSIKELYSTNYFETIDIKFDNGIIFIQVVERPLVQSIIIDGIKSSEQIKAVKDFILLKEKNPYLKNDLLKAQNSIINFLKQSGYYFAKVKSTISENDNNTIDVNIKIDRGNKASIKKIRFIGNKIYKDNKLLNVIVSEEDKFWKLISNKKFLNVERIQLDKRLLKNFYLEKGYYKVSIVDAFSQIINETDFILTYKIDAGQKFLFGDLSLNLPKDFDEKKFSKLNNIFSQIKNDVYDIRKIEEILNEIEQISLQSNYEFIDAKVTEVVKDNYVNFNFDIIESKKVYISKINILGNNTSAEEFIRNQLLSDEGDPLNNILLNKSLNILRSSGFFKSVDLEIKDGDSDNQKVVDIKVVEKPTGEIIAAAGYGTDGATISFGIKENNFKGLGIKLDTELTVRSDSIKGSFFYTQPNFAYSDKDLISSIESTSTDKLSKSGYKSNLNRISLGTSYEQYQNTYFSPSISISLEDIETTSSASSSYKKQEGSYFDPNFSYGIDYDLRNSPFQPSDGFISSWYQTVPLSNENASLFNSYALTNYSEIADNMTLSTGFLIRSINSISDDDVRVSKRLYIPSARLRGFESGKVGPKDGNDFVGGNYMTTINTSSTLPFLLNDFQNIDVKFFIDIANLWGVDYSSAIDDSNKIRSSTGLAAEVLTPVGPLSFSIAQPITKASTDKIESFRFQLGTTF